MAHKPARYTEISKFHRILTEKFLASAIIAIETGLWLNEPKSNIPYCKNIIYSSLSSPRIPLKSG